MAYKQFALDERTPVTIYKRKSNRSLRLSVAADGAVKVSIPVWTPYKAGLQFARSKLDWIASQHRPGGQLVSGQPVGKAHRLRFEPVSGAYKTTSRIRQNEVTIYYPETFQLSDPEVQNMAKTAGLRALRKQAEALLPKRLEDLAMKHGFDYGTVTIKQMRSRWGSCDQHRNIVLNLFLIQLPWDCIDYVLLHELTHTRVLKHGPEFWQAMEQLLPNVKETRKLTRSYQPMLHNSPRSVA